MKCTWCHEPVSDEMQRVIPPLLELLGTSRRRYVEDTWGMPEQLCAADFNVMLTQANKMVSEPRSVSL